MDNLRLKLLTYGLLAYILLAFLWWSVLLFTKNRDAFQAKADKWQLVLAAQGKIDTPDDFLKTDLYQNMRRDYQRQEWMIVTEGVALLGGVIIGIYFVYRGYQREVVTTKQQRNFLLSITHELKSPIAGIRLILETFQNRKELSPAIKEKLSASGLRETDRLTGLVEDLLLSAKLESRHYELQREALDLGEIIVDTAEKVQSKYPTAKIDLDIEEDLPFFSGDPGGMVSVALNLIENAAKYSQPNPEIRIELYRRGSELHWNVADNGPGISDADKKRIWRKFYRVGSEDTRISKGTGLGLYIVRQLVDIHDGTIRVVDNEPRGSRFEVRLPLTKAPGERDAETSITEDVIA
jgi:signal transduction histidine kinase